MSAIKIRTIAGSGIVTEGPHWDEKTDSLLYVDIPDGTINRYFNESGRRQELKIEAGITGQSVSFVLPAAADPDVLIIGHGRTLAGVRWLPGDSDSSSTRAVAITSVEDGKQTRFNDGKCDPQGRIWAGTMGFETSPGVLDKHQAALYRFDDNMRATACVDKISLSNGLAWSNDRKFFYYIDTLELRVDVFDYDDSTGLISNRRTVTDYASIGLTEDLPDGMTTDVNGNLWVANYFGRKIICLDPMSGKLIRQVDTLTKSPTSVCWGGRDYSNLYFTSGRIGLNEEEVERNPSSGGVFEITGLGCKGYPAVSANVSQALLDQIKAGTMAPTIKAVTPPATLGEAPFWEARHNCLLYVDIFEFEIHRYFPETGRHQVAKVEEGDSGASVSFVLPSADDPEVLFIGHGRNLAAVKWSPSDPDESTIRAVRLASVDQGKTTRFNDGKCDPQGRIWAGMMSSDGNFETKQSSLYRFSVDLVPTRMVGNVMLSNGLTWSADLKTFYYIDTGELRVDAFDYDDPSGDISNRRTILDYKEAGITPDRPDGMELDTDGNLWVAHFGGSKIRCIDPIKKAVVQTLELPAVNVTSVCWGGPAYDVFYVTTARFRTTDEELKLMPNAGAVFEVTGLGCRGTAARTARVDAAVLEKVTSQV
ncbi:uncharacterized protein LOC108672784 [Hyalella azteca]|uniref:Regucalcin n=1 Tax=Hyalella azteca TaxID=294128 RepID=A0A979FTV0_HYAAZ|nr:uncharacterized protein LOC108672784 [Hyalella azteca]